MRAGIAPQDHSSNVAPKALTQIRLFAAKKQSSAGLHEGTVEISRLEVTFSHLRQMKKNTLTSGVLMSFNSILYK